MSNRKCRIESLHFANLVQRVYVRIMEIGNLFQVREDDVLVIANDTWNIGVVEWIQVTFNDQLKIPAKFFLGLNQFLNYRPKGIDN